MQHKYWSDKTEEVLYFVSSNEELMAVYESLIQENQAICDQLQAAIDAWRDAGRPPNLKPMGMHAPIRSLLRPKRRAVIEYWENYGWLAHHHYSGVPIKRVTILKKPAHPVGSVRRMALLTGQLELGHEIRDGKLVPIKSDGS